MTDEEKIGFNDLVSVVRSGQAPSIRRWDEWGKGLLAAAAELTRLREAVEWARIQFVTRDLKFLSDELRRRAEEG